MREVMKPTDPDYQRFYGDEGMWKNTLHNERRGEEPTVSTVVYYHEDPVLDIHVTDEYHFFVAHVRGFHGKGFMPCCRFNYGNACQANGEVVYGTSQAAYDKAVEAGKLLLNQQQAEMDELKASVGKPKTPA